MSTLGALLPPFTRIHWPRRGHRRIVSGGGKVTLMAMWRVVSKADPVAIALADRHYSRILYGKQGRQLAPPGRSITLLSNDSAAVWVSHWPYAEYALDGLDAFRCSLFRVVNCAYRASALILEAMTITETKWGSPPLWITYVRPDALRGNPGYCFKVVGFHRDRSWANPHLHRLIHA